jgi:beta-glucosidase
LEEFDLNKYEYLYPFGHGLSYTTFTYSNLKLSTTSLTGPKELQVEVTIQNTGNMDGKETVMLFINQEYGSVPRPMRQLKKFEKINLRRGESRVVKFTLNMYDLSFINLKSERVYEAGKINIFVGRINDHLSASFTLENSGKVNFARRSAQPVLMLISFLLVFNRLVTYYL